MANEINLMKLCHMMCHTVGIITYIQHLRAPPFKKLGKNFQNSARFRTTFDFDRKYLWNGLRY